MNLQLYIKASLLLTFSSMTITVFGQHTDAQQLVSPDVLQLQNQLHGHYRKTSQLDSVKAEQVLKVQVDYKTAFDAVVADTSLDKLGRSTQISVLIEQKNQKLRSFLSPAQQEKIIPTTERTPANEV